MTTTDQTSAEPQAGGAGDPQPQAGNTTTTEPQAGDSQDTALSLEELKKLRSEGRALRDRLKAAEAKAAELDKLREDEAAKKLSETERLQKQVADLQAKDEATTKREQALRITSEIKVQAMAAGVPATRLDKVVRLIDSTDITFEDGSPTNVKDLMDALLKDMPELIGKAAPPSSGGATNPSRSQTSGLPTLSHASIASLTAAQYNAMSPEQRQAISQFQRDNPHRF
jgi:hypothetical protein